jgi:hypothetical protein
VGNNNDERSFRLRHRCPKGNGMKRCFPHRLVEACIRTMYISYGADRCGSAAARTPHKHVGAACGNP